MLKVLTRWLLLPLAVLIVLLMLAWFAMRQYASHQAIETDRIASSSGACLLKTYVRNYASLGVVGRMASAFGSSHFYRVYNNAGERLATSEWNLGETEVSTFATEWHGQMAMYPTRHGWASFSLKECGPQAAQKPKD